MQQLGCNIRTDSTCVITSNLTYLFFVELRKRGRVLKKKREKVSARACASVKPVGDAEAGLPHPVIIQTSRPQ